MKLAIFALAAVCLVAVCHATQDGGDFDYEEEAPAAPAPTKASPKSQSKLGSLLSPRNRGAAALTPRKSGAAPAASPKTTTTTEAPAEEAEEDYGEEGVEEEEKQEPITTSSTTEAPKKNGRRGGVRPFRSNEDLLAALKRRRAQGLSNITKEPSSTHVPAEAAPSKSKSQPISRAKTNEVSKGNNRARFGGGRNKAAAPAQEEVEETKTEDVKAKPYRARG